ncbi:aspartate, glycine, lysine and serine-rich protein isoform X3 [Oncorhynchus mykiss]|uniref:aspartate, glycine, lysine and serine-rich protein isoform X3 n=1 Tax=Oncorhynchus mykiss TaxID=8022 RepID=UPI0018783F44|nr:aspartate, glycine, lysine and serine-rich protein isoform X3 [Oncorhynchus mykiss]
MADQGISTPSVIGLVTIFCCIYGGQFVNAAGPSTTRYVITNGNVILNPGIPGGVLQEILWKHGVNKAVEWSTDRIQEFRDFKGRTSLNTTTGEITIRQLTMQLSGVYEAECVIGKKIQTFQQRVEVIDPVSQPDVTCELNGTVATIHCSAEGPLLEYRWSWPDHQGEMWSQEQTGQHYNITSPESVSYTCEARNPVSKKTQTYNSIDCLATGNPVIYIYTGIGAGVLLLVAVVVAVVVWLVKKRSKDLRSTGNASHLEEDREKVVAISQAEIVEEENKLLLDEELKDRVNQINQASEAVKTGDGEGEKKPLLDKAGSTDTDVIVSNIPFKLNNQNQVWGWESGKRQREEKEQNTESKQNMNVTLGTVTQDSVQTAPPKPPRSSLNYNSPYPQTLETQHSREHHGRGTDQSMAGYGTEREGAGDGQLMPQKVLILDTEEESGGKEEGTREDGEDVEKVGGDDSVTEEGEGQEDTDRRDDGGERNGQERETENNEEEQVKGEGEERGKKGEETQKGEKRKSPTSPKQTLPQKAPPPPLAPKPSSIRHVNQMGVEQGSVVKTMETQRSSGQVDRGRGRPDLSGLRRPTSSVSDSTDTPDRSSPGLSALPIATAFSPKVERGTLSNPVKASSGAPSRPGDTSSGAPSRPGDTSSGAPSRPGDTSSGAPSGPGDTSSGAPSGPGDTSSGAPSGPGDTSSGAPSGPGDTSSDTTSTAIESSSDTLSTTEENIPTSKATASVPGETS